MDSTTTDTSDLGANNAPTQLLSRVLSFTKTEDDTGIRVSYTDNRGCYGIPFPNEGNIACQWEIHFYSTQFDGTQCITPSNLAYAYYSNHTGVGGILVFTRSETVVGTCFAIELDTDTGELGLPAGDYEIQVWIAPVPGFIAGDFNTGLSSYWALEAEEVR